MSGPVGLIGALRPIHVPVSTTLPIVEVVMQPNIWYQIVMPRLMGVRKRNKTKPAVFLLYHYNFKMQIYNLLSTKWKYTSYLSYLK